MSLFIGDKRVTLLGIGGDIIRPASNFTLWMFDDATNRLYTVDKTTGVATAATASLGDFRAPNGMAFDGFALYMGVLRAFWCAIPGTLNPVLLNSSTLSQGSGTAGLVWDGTTMYLAESRIGSGVRTHTLRTIDRTSGNTVRVGTFSSTEIKSLGWNGTTLYTTTGDNFLYRIDKSNANVTRVGSTGSVGITGLAWDGSTMYGLGDTANALYTIDLSTGAATRVGSATNFGVGVTSPQALAWAPAVLTS